MSGRYHITRKEQSSRIRQTRPPGAASNLHDLLEENNTLRRQVRVLLNQKGQRFDQGFLAAVEMVEAGATLERLRDAVVDFEMDDTKPIETT